jgi:hypothetical protein
VIRRWFYNIIIHKRITNCITRDMLNVYFKVNMNNRSYVVNSVTFKKIMCVFLHTNKNFRFWIINQCLGLFTIRLKSTVCALYKTNTINVEDSVSS